MPSGEGTESRDHHRSAAGAVSIQVVSAAAAAAAAASDGGFYVAREGIAGDGRGGGEGGYDGSSDAGAAKEKTMNGPSSGPWSVSSSVCSRPTKKGPSSRGSVGRRAVEEFGQRFRADPGYVDVDTRVSRESYDAARMAAGAVVLAVRC